MFAPVVTKCPPSPPLHHCPRPHMWRAFVSFKGLEKCSLTFNNVYDICLPSFQEKLKADYLKDVKSTFQRLSDFLGDRKFIAGDKV